MNDDEVITHCANQVREPRGREVCYTLSCRVAVEVAVEAATVVGAEAAAAEAVDSPRVRDR